MSFQRHSHPIGTSLHEQAYLHYSRRPPSLDASPRWPAPPCGNTLSLGLAWCQRDKALDRDGRTHPLHHRARVKRFLQSSDRSRHVEVGSCSTPCKFKGAGTGCGQSSADSQPTQSIKSEQCEPHRSGGVMKPLTPERGGIARAPPQRASRLH